MARYSPADSNSKAPTTLSPSSSYSIRFRIPVFGPLRRLVASATSQKDSLLGQVTDGESFAKHKPGSSPVSSASISSGQTTLRSHSLDALDLTMTECPPLPDYCNNEDLRANAAEMAMRLWMTARNPERCPDPRWQAQARTMQIDAVRYINMALPSDLSSAESALVRAAVPYQVLSGQSTIQNDLKPTVLRSTVAQVVALLVAWLAFLLPLLTLLMNMLQQYERDHHITERLMLCAQAIVRGLGQYGFRLRSTLVHFLGSTRGQKFMASSAYLVEGIAGGVLDGCGYRDTPILRPEGGSWTGPRTAVGVPL